MGGTPRVPSKGAAQEGPGQGVSPCMIEVSLKTPSKSKIPSAVKQPDNSRIAPLPKVLKRQGSTDNVPMITGLIRNPLKDDVLIAFSP